MNTAVSPTPIVSKRLANSPYHLFADREPEVERVFGNSAALRPRHDARERVAIVSRVNRSPSGRSGRRPLTLTPSRQSSFC